MKERSWRGRGGDDDERKIVVKSGRDEMIVMRPMRSAKKKGRSWVRKG
jgi:hypothetical protein